MNVKDFHSKNFDNFFSLYIFSYTKNHMKSGSRKKREWSNLGKILLLFGYWSNHGRSRPLNSKLNWCGLILVWNAKHVRTDEFHIKTLQNIDLHIFSKLRRNMFQNWTNMSPLSRMMHEEWETSSRYIILGIFLIVAQWIKSFTRGGGGFTGKFMATMKASISNISFIFQVKCFFPVHRVEETDL